MREPPGIREEHLRTCLQDQYGLISVLLEFLPLGHDYQAGVYHVVSVQDKAYLLKVTSRLLYESSCLVLAYLRDQGISSIVAPVPTYLLSLGTGRTRCDSLSPQHMFSGRLGRRNQGPDRTDIS
jgi:hypothetical protein